MKQFLKDVIDTLKDNAEEFESNNLSIQTYKKGVLPPLPTFPAVSVLPQRELFNYGWTGGKFKIEKEAELQFYVKGLNLKDARKQLRALVEMSTHILTDNYTVNNDDIYDLYIEDETYDDPLTLANSILQGCNLTIHGYKYDYKPLDKLPAENLVYTNQNEIVESIYNFFKAYKNHQDYPLTSINSLSVNSIGTAVRFPAVLITGSLDNTRERSFTGIDTLFLQNEFSIYTKLMDKDAALYSNLDLSYNIFRLLQIANSLGGRFLNAEVMEINYTRNISERLGLVYESVIRWDAEILEPLNREAFGASESSRGFPYTFGDFVLE